MGLGGYWLGTRYSPSPAHPVPIPRVHPPMPPTATMQVFTGTDGQDNMVVGLISVDQLTLEPEISRFQGMTEGYNLVKIGRINNHSLIVGTE